MDKKTELIISNIFIKRVIFKFFSFLLKNLSYFVKNCLLKFHNDKIVEIKTFTFTFFSFFIY